MTERPKTRADCVNGPRPCPWFTCRYHLLVDVQANGKLRMHPRANGDADRLIDLMTTQDTCALDVAEQAGITVEKTAQILGVSERRVLQLGAEGRQRLMVGRTDSIKRLIWRVAAHRRKTGKKPQSAKSLRRQWMRLPYEQRPALAKEWREEIGE